MLRCFAPRTVHSSHGLTCVFGVKIGVDGDGADVDTGADADDDEEKQALAEVQGDADAKLVELRKVKGVVF